MNRQEKLCKNVHIF